MHDIGNMINRHDYAQTVLSLHFKQYITISSIYFIITENWIFQKIYEWI